VTEDPKIPGGELVIDIRDDGDGMDIKALNAFFNLGDSTRVNADGMKVEDAIGEKGHGTKTYFNSREIEVYTATDEKNRLYAVMIEPLRELLQYKVPQYEYDPATSADIAKGTRIVIRGFNQNVKKDFSHRILKDHILWFTKFGSVDWIFEKERPKVVEESSVYRRGLKLYLHGLGYDGDWEEIGYGHQFPAERVLQKELKAKNPDQPMRWYVKRWIDRGVPVKEHPQLKLDIVFCLEGDLARRDVNPMISYQGKHLEGDYTIEQRYGLWACKDYIPIKTVNDWFSAGKSEWTKFHAFVNCQGFSLTANRADINNTDPKILEKIEETIKDFYEGKVADCSQYHEYLAAVQEQEAYRSAKQESTDFSTRQKRIGKKHIAVLNGVELVAPGVAVKGARGQEVGVHCLFAQMCALHPGLFPFIVVDYDTHLGYDCLVTHSSVFDLTQPKLAFLEFKYRLDTEFNHSFDNLAYVVCWECDLNDNSEVRDLRQERRVLKIFEKSDERDHKTYYLQALGKPHNIEVFVLREYLKDKLGLEFKPRSSAA
jgi:hypothetical protein